MFFKKTTLVACFISLSVQAEILEVDVFVEGNQNADIPTITQADVLDRQTNSLIEILKQSPNLQVVQNGSTSRIHFAGTNSNHSVLLINGQKINNISTHSLPLTLLNARAIDNIEVIDSSVNAIGGVFNVSLKQDVDLLSLQANAKQQDFYLNKTFKRDALQANLAFNFKKDKNINLMNDDYDFYDLDGNKSLGANFSLAYKNFEMNLLKQKSLQKYDDNYGRFDLNTFQSFATDKQETASLNLADIAFINKYKNLTSKFIAAYNQQKSNDEDFLYKDYLYSTNNKNLSLSVFNELKINKDVVRLNLDSSKDELTTSNNYKRTTQKTNNITLDVHKFISEKTNLNVVLKNSNNDIFKDNQSYKLAIHQQINNKHYFNLSFNSAYALPSFSQLYYPNYSNENLQPEKAQKVNLQYVVKYQNLSLQSSLYQQKIKDLIASDENYIPQNINKAEIKGVNFNISHQFNNWTNKFNLNFVNSKDANTNKYLIYKAKQFADISSIYNSQKWQAILNLNTQGKSFVDRANKQNLAGFTLLNVGYKYFINDKLNLNLKVNNLLDKKYASTLYTDLNGNYKAYNEKQREILAGVSYFF